MANPQHKHSPDEPPIKKTRRNKSCKTYSSRTSKKETSSSGYKTHQKQMAIKRSQDAHRFKTRAQYVHLTFLGASGLCMLLGGIWILVISILYPEKINALGRVSSLAGIGGGVVVISRELSKLHQRSRRSLKEEPQFRRTLACKLGASNPLEHTTLQIPSQKRWEDVTLPDTSQSLFRDQSENPGQQESQD